MSAPEPSMPVNITATSARRQFGDVVQRTYSGKEHFVVEKDGLPVVAIISMAEYQEFMRERENRQYRLNQFRKTARAFGQEVEKRGLTEDDAEMMIETTRQQLHEEQHGKRPQ